MRFYEIFYYLPKRLIIHKYSPSIAVTTLEVRSINFVNIGINDSIAEPITGKLKKCKLSVDTK